MSGEKVCGSWRHQLTSFPAAVFMLAVVFDWASQAHPCGVWSPSAIPVTSDGADGAATELGVRFQSDVPGYILGIRFYRAATNTGVHPVSLWQYRHVIGSHHSDKRVCRRLKGSGFCHAGSHCSRYDLRGIVLRSQRALRV